MRRSLLYLGSSYLGYIMALTQQKWLVEGVLGSFPEVPVSPIFINTLLYLRSPKGLGVSLGAPLGSGGQEDSGEGSRRPRVIPGGSWRGLWHPLFLLF